MRADAPTLKFETGRVRAGGRREGRVCDIDGWYGPDVAQGVKVTEHEVGNFADLDDFLGNLVDWPAAITVAICDAAIDEVVGEAASHDITMITREQLVEAVQLWPHQKQMEAVRATIEYLVHTEKDDALIRAFAEFLDAEGIGLGLKAQADAQREIAPLAGDDDPKASVAPADERSWGPAGHQGVNGLDRTRSHSRRATSAAKPRNRGSSQTPPPPPASPSGDCQS